MEKDVVSTSCAKCKLRIEVAAGQIKLVDPASKCQRKAAPTDCYGLKAAVAEAYRTLRAARPGGGYGYTPLHVA
jgi:hypothetical protein